MFCEHEVLKYNLQCLFFDRLSCPLELDTLEKGGRGWSQGMENNVQGKMFVS